MARLDKEIYELFLLLPLDIQRQVATEEFRDRVKNKLTYVGAALYKDKISIVQEAKDVLKEFPVDERRGVITKFFEIKGEKERALKNRREAAKTKLLGNFMYILSTVSLITMVIMILVLLAVERNTRKVE
jgi:peptide subunit release factor 1 (eRF1)